MTGAGSDGPGVIQINLLEVAPENQAELIPLGDGDSALHRAGAPYGAAAVPVRAGSLPNEDELEVARFQGARVTRVAAALRAAGLTAVKS